MSEELFFHFGTEHSNADLAEWRQEEVELESIRCPLHSGHERGGRRLTNLSVTLPGEAIDDVMWTWQSECLITDRVLKIFRAEALTGFEVKGVKAAFKQSNRKPPRLWELIITGWAGIAPAESGIRLLERCEACSRTVYSTWTTPDRLVNVSEWDGSDFFLVWPLPKYIFATGRVADAVRNYSLSGVSLEPIEKLVSPTSVIPRLSPGRLSYYMPDQRAFDLGASLGIY